MKANQAFQNKNDRAEVGVGTLIVFIAMVLVAAVAAAVLINTTGALQQRAQATGKEATQEVSSNLKVVNVYGIVQADAVNDAANKIDELRVFITLSAGATPLDLEQMILRYSDGTNTFNYAFDDAWQDVTDGCAPGDGSDVGDASLLETTVGGATDEQEFVLNWIRPAAAVGNLYGCSSHSVMDAGDLVEVRFRLDAGEELDVRTPVSVQLIPESGSPVSADFKTPATYGDASTITLR